jgi:hypothetical protein
MAATSMIPTATKVHCARFDTAMSRSFVGRSRTAGRKTATSSSSSFLPNRPPGRSTSTAITIPKKTVSATPSVDVRHRVRNSATPTTMPPTNAPGSEVSPPTSAAASARTKRPVDRLVMSSEPCAGMISNAASAANTAPAAHVNDDTRRAEMPRSCAASRFSAVARMAMPKRVNLKKAAVAKAMIGTITRIVT